MKFQKEELSICTKNRTLLQPRHVPVSSHSLHFLELHLRTFAKHGSGYYCYFMLKQ